MNYILENLYVGSMQPVGDLDQLNSKQIKYILCCAKEINDPLFQDVNYIYKYRILNTNFWV